MDRKKILIIIGSLIAIVITMILVILLNDKKQVTYNVIFKTDGGSVVKAQSINEGDKVKKPIDPIKDGYEFVEWTYKNQTYDFSLKVKSDLILIAKWVKINQDVETCIIKFNTDGGTTIPNQIINKGDKISKPNDPIKEGYVFKGWLLKGEIYDFEKDIEEDSELVANWEKEKNEDPIKKSTNKSTNNNSSVSNNTSSKVTSQTTTNKPNSTTPSTTVIKKEYTVVFNSVGGSSINSQAIVEGGKVTRPPNPTKEGYNFDTWLLNGNTYDFNSIVSGNITLIAKWNQKSYSVVANKVDNTSSFSMKLSAYENGNLINVKEIRYSDGIKICSGSNANVNYYAIKDETTLKLVLLGGTEVTASLTIVQ